MTFQLRPDRPWATRIAFGTGINAQSVLNPQIVKKTYPVTLWARLWISLFTSLATRIQLDTSASASFLGSAAVCVFPGSALC